VDFLSTEFILDVKFTFFVVFLTWLIGEAYDAHEALKIIPELDELQFSLINNSLSDEVEFVNKYEEVILGKNALRWVRDNFLNEFENVNSLLQFLIEDLTTDIPKLKAIEDKSSNEFLELSKRVNNTINFVNRYIDIVKENMEKKRFRWVTVLNPNLSDGAKINELYKEFVRKLEILKDEFNKKYAE
jgi:hypothetical protein